MMVAALILDIVGDQKRKGSDGWMVDVKYCTLYSKEERNSGWTGGLNSGKDGGWERKDSTGRMADLNYGTVGGETERENRDAVMGVDD